MRAPLLFAPYRLQASGPLLLDLLELRLDDVVLAVLGLAVGGAVTLGRRTATRLRAGSRPPLDE